LKTIWTNIAKQELKQIFDYFKYVKLTPSGANTIKMEIIEASRSIRFPEQYQIDEINSNYRRVIVRNYKIVYRVENEIVYILRIFDTRQNPNKLF